MLAWIGAVAGLASGLFGVGGGFLIVPLQLLFTGVSTRRASGTSMAALIPIAVAGACGYYVQDHAHLVDLQVAAFLVIGSTGGAYVGARVIQVLPDDALTSFVVLVMLLVGVDQIAGVVVHPSFTQNLHDSLRSVELRDAFLVGSGLVIGSASASIGVGGGILFVPAMVVGLGLDQQVAQGTSLVAILPTATVGAVTHLRQGNVDLRTASWIGLAGLPTAVAGAFVAVTLPQRFLAALFGMLLVLAATRIATRRRKRNLQREKLSSPGRGTLQRKSGQRSSWIRSSWEGRQP
jgi:uncharacterized membrane protein YfcA